jgi:hypothetical protein
MEQPNDLLKARTEAALLLRLDPSNLSPSDTLRCDLIASLRLVVDDASASVLDGRAPDLARLLTATESLIRLLPSEPPQPASRRIDPRQIMWETYLGMRRRGELDPTTYDGQRRRIAELEAKVAELEAAASPALEEPSAPPAPAGNVVNLPRAGAGLQKSAAAPAAPPKPAPPPPTDEERARALAIANAPVPQHVRDTRPPNEAWRNFVRIDWQG